MQFVLLELMELLENIYHFSNALASLLQRNNRKNIYKQWRRLLPYYRSLLKIRNNVGSEELRKTLLYGDYELFFIVILYVQRKKLRFQFLMC